MVNSGGKKEEVYHVEMLNKDLLEAHQYTIKSLQEVNASPKTEKRELMNEGFELSKKTNKLWDESDKLVEGRNKLKQERKLLGAERNELKVDMAHFRKDGERNTKKLR